MARTVLFQQSARAALLVASGVGSSFGTSTCSAIGGSSTAAGSSAGVATVSGVGAVILWAAGQAAGLGVALGKTPGSVGTTSGVAVVNGIGLTINAAVAAASGQAALMGFIENRAQRASLIIHLVGEHVPTIELDGVHAPTVVLTAQLGN